METGTLQAVDKNNKPIMVEGFPVNLEWYKTTNHATMIDLQKKALPVVEEAFADEEINFLLDDQFRIKKEFAYLSDQPEQAPVENSFIANARVDREKRVEFSHQQWKQWFATTAQAVKDVPFKYFFVMAKNSRGDVLGFSAFYISPMLPKFLPEFDVYTKGDVVLEPVAITPAAQGHGLARPLIFSILTLAPETKRILLGTRIWITNAMAMYNKLGFTEYKREGIGVKFKYVVKK